MKVYVSLEDGLELVGRTSLREEMADDYVVDLDIPGTGAALRLTYAVHSVPWLTPQLTLGTERAVVLSLGQTPDFLPGWQRVDPDAI
ncbi:hypothetical protein EJV46_07730 [Roseococcus sp. SYP-B2431]|uniref:hypothetical protein n=1 Tax=Roseococcus sp. SYP-B2431 TaxID=2496640 RepID=UPI00103ADC00|nr:hypothetical protein [Roseococcus sp. SYP-B2431]TCI00510.1 hypothetical protein EJV46_07730 [Roseococcus sp. SYP-B2431]